MSAQASFGELLDDGVAVVQDVRELAELAGGGVRVGLDTEGKDTSRSRESRRKRGISQSSRTRASRRSKGGTEWFPLMGRDGLPQRDHAAPAVYPSLLLRSASAYADLVAVALKKLAMALPDGVARRSLLRKAMYLPLCGKGATGVLCDEFGEVDRADLRSKMLAFIPHSGRLSSLVSCDSRGCSRCSRAKSADVVGRLSAAVERVPERPGYSWKFLTFTAWRDPADPRSVSVDALRATADALGAGFRSFYAGVKAKGFSPSAYSRVECSEGGHVHLHALAYLPFVLWGDVAGLFASGFNAQNEGTYRYAVAAQCLDAQPASPDSVREIVKYVVKGISPLDEGFLAGDSARRVLHPDLVAAFEAAVCGVQLGRAFGELRGLLADERKRSEVEIDDTLGETVRLPAVCPYCGGDGECYRKVSFARAGPAACVAHELEIAFLAGSRWRALGEPLGSEIERVSLVRFSTASGARYDRSVALVSGDDLRHHV